MSDYDNTNRGALFRAEKRETENHPTHTGALNVDGTEYWLSAWVKESKAGAKFFSLSVKPKDAKPAKQAKKPARDDDDGDVPF